MAPCSEVASEALKAVLSSKRFALDLIKGKMGLFIVKVLYLEINNKKGNPNRHASKKSITGSEVLKMPPSGRGPRKSRYNSLNP